MMILSGTNSKMPLQNSIKIPNAQTKAPMTTMQQKIRSSLCIISTKIIIKSMDMAPTVMTQLKINTIIDGLMKVQQQLLTTSKLMKS